MRFHAVLSLVAAVAGTVGVVSAEPVPAPTAPAVGDPSLVGYISTNGGYADGRTCDFPATMSTSGNFAKCCPTTGTCDFFTACSSNTLLGGPAPVPCDTDTMNMCNTAILAATAGANGGKSYLACWQKTLGTGAFTFVQNIGSATVAPAATTGAASVTVAGSSSGAASGSAMTTSAAGSGSSAAGGSSAAAGAATSSPSKAAAAAGSERSMIGGGLMAAILAAVQAML